MGHTVTSLCLLSLVFANAIYSTPWPPRTTLTDSEKPIAKRQLQTVTSPPYNAPTPDGCVLSVGHERTQCMKWRNCVEQEGAGPCTVYNNGPASTVQYSSCMCGVYASCYDNKVDGALNNFDELDRLRNWITINACPAAAYPGVTITHPYGNLNKPQTSITADCIEDCKRELLSSDSGYSQCVSYGSTIGKTNECDCSALTRRCPRSCKNVGTAAFSAFSSLWYPSHCAEVPIPLTWGWQNWPALELNSQ